MTFGGGRQELWEEAGHDPETTGTLLLSHGEGVNPVGEAGGSGERGLKRQP